jgi:phosphatidylglycerophosphate synthase
VQRVQLAPLLSVIAGTFGLGAIGWFGVLAFAGWCAGLLYLVCSNALLARGLRRRGTTRFGAANAATALRSTLVALITALVTTSFMSPIPVPLLISLTVVALSMDAVDGWLARRTASASELGARFDMEVDAFLLLVLAVYVAKELGWWVLIIGLLRYGFVAAGWVLPWMRSTLPPRYWRKVVTAAAGVGLTIAASALLPTWAGLIATLVALALLIESFTRDVVWLYRRRAEA